MSLVDDYDPVPLELQDEDVVLEAEDSEEVIDYDPVPPELRDGDVVLEVGAYEGAWIKKVIEQGQYVLYGFEPASRAFKAARKELRGESVALFNVALGKEKGTAILCDRDRDGANTYGHNPENEPNETVQVMDVAEFVRPLGEVALMHLNAEGGEVDVLERLIETGLVRNVRMLLVQWHPYDDEMWARIKDIMIKLGDTHDREDRTAWGCWTRKDARCQKSSS